MLLQFVYYCLMKILENYWPWVSFSLNNFLCPVVSACLSFQFSRIPVIGILLCFILSHRF